MSRKNSFYFIDYGSRGTSGGYAASFIDQLPKNLKTTCYMHSEYPLKDKNSNIYGRFGRFDRLEIPKTLKLPIKFFELYFDFFLIAMDIFFDFIRNKKPIVILNLYQNLSSYKHFISLVSCFSKTIVMIHDAIPHKNSYPSFILSSHQEIVSGAAGIGYFGDESGQIVKNYKKDTYRFTFPSFKKLFVEDGAPKTVLSKKIKFLFIGHIRHEKGFRSPIGCMAKDRKL